MPYKSDAQRKYFNANRAELEAQGVDVDEWNESSRGKKLPPKAKKKNAEKSAVALLAKLAADPISATLQGLLSNCLDLSLLLKHCHWNVRGTMFSPVHKFLDEVYELTVEISDDIAERMVALDYPASGISSDVVDKSSMGDMATKFIGPETIINELTTKLTKLVDMFKSGITETDSDPVTSNMLQDMTHKLEKSLWMLRSQKPNAATKEASNFRNFTDMFSDYSQPTDIKELAKAAAGRCWKGYEPVPGKEPYSEDSCRPVGGKKKKQEKKSAIQELAKLAAEADRPCSCNCGDTVSTCKCGADCKCRKEGGSCYKGEKAAGSPAWQRSEGKNSEGGLNAKGRASYNKSTGGNLKAPVTQKNPKGEAKGRKASFCARMGGMKKKLTGEETKNDPDSRINKALRKWNC